MANIAVCSLAMDPKNPNVIYAGAGEGYFNIDGSINGRRGAGIFKTTDGGATWTRLASTTTEDFYYVNDIVVSPANSQRLYAATGAGVFRSLDGGASWTRILNPTKPSSATTGAGGCLDLAIGADKASDYLFASCGTIISLAIAPSDQSVIYAAAASIAEGDFLDGLHAVFRSREQRRRGHRDGAGTQRQSDQAQHRALLQVRSPPPNPNAALADTASSPIKAGTTTPSRPSERTRPIRT
jgi:hypothetical protein